VEEELPVLYVYELQMEPPAQGKVMWSVHHPNYLVFISSEYFSWYDLLLHFFSFHLCF
jgi:hypothetical protein